jgi:hypothetical protein
MMPNSLIDLYLRRNKCDPTFDADARTPRVRSDEESKIVKTRVLVRYVSGRQEQFEVELFGGQSAEARLREFTKDPTIVLQSEKEVVIIPATAIESITLPLPEAAGRPLALPNVRKGKRLK